MCLGYGLTFEFLTKYINYQFKTENNHFYLGYSLTGYLAVSQMISIMYMSLN